MKTFIDNNFLLHSKTAQELYHKHAARMPVIDYHCHLDPRAIYEDTRYENITKAWLLSDHYKWRLMRNAGVDESWITGKAGDWEKFEAFAEVLPQTIGNPIYHWTHLELQRYFDCRETLNDVSAHKIWEHCNERLRQDPDLSVRGIIKQSNVEVIVTTDDPIDTLEWHTKLQNDPSFTSKILPGFRPDKAVDIRATGYKDYINRLSEASDISIDGIISLKQALGSRIDYFFSHTRTNSKLCQCECAG